MSDENTSVTFDFDQIRKTLAAVEANTRHAKKVVNEYRLRRLIEEIYLIESDEFKSEFADRPEEAEELRKSVWHDWLELRNKVKLNEIRK